ncbi:hypothetical protein BGX30_015249 [Mortierella sp. GBA39]|nr:hypothetical protein BGX30_015249 [Mortierella sp. GBA39]
MENKPRTKHTTITSQKHKVFGGQDILAHIVSYLHPKSQVACLQVSRHFHKAIAPAIYASVTLGPMEDYRPSLEALRRYSSLVTALSFDGFISAEYLGAGFRNLMSLSLVNDEDSYHFQQGTDNEIMEALLKVIKENPRLRQWSFEKPYPALSAKVWEAIEGTAYKSPEAGMVESHIPQGSTATHSEYSSTSVVIAPLGGSDIHRVSFRIVKERVLHGRLRSGIELLQVTPASISQKALPWATSACEKAEALLMIPAKLEPFDAPREFPDRVLPRLCAPIAHYVGLHNVRQCSSMEQLEFLSLFNQARGIYWNIYKRPSVAKWKRVPPTIKDWKQWIRPDTTWPHLRSLVLCCYRLLDSELDNQFLVFPDDCVAHALKCIPRGQLEQFWWHGAQMGPLGIDALAGHFSTLREVKLELTSSLEQSAYIQRIMESCMHLKVLRAGYLSVGDMRRGRPWACIGLKSLSLRFNMQEDRIKNASNNNTTIARPATAERKRRDYKESQCYVFSRLSELVLLEELTSIPLQAAGSNFHETWNLDFQLRYGLGALSTLQQLKRLDVSFTKQQMHFNDINWMEDHLDLKWVAATGLMPLGAAAVYYERDSVARLFNTTDGDDAKDKKPAHHDSKGNEFAVVTPQTQFPKILNINKDLIDISSSPSGTTERSKDWTYTNLNHMVWTSISYSRTNATYRTQTIHAPLPTNWTELPRIDIVVISHSHHDHLDLTTIQKLQKDYKSFFYVHFGNKVWFHSTGIKDKVTECDWWDEHEHNFRLMGTKSAQVFFGGDTGYRYVPKGADENC